MVAIAVELSLTHKRKFVFPLVIMMVVFAQPFKVLDPYPVPTLGTQMTTKADCLTCALAFLVFSSLWRAETRYTSSVNVIERDTAATMHLPRLHQRCFQKFVTFSLRRATGAELKESTRDRIDSLNVIFLLWCHCVNYFAHVWNWCVRFLKQLIFWSWGCVFPKHMTVYYYNVLSKSMDLGHKIVK